MSNPDDSRRVYPSRRDVIVLGIGAFAVAALPFVRRRPARLTRRTVPLMGTLAEIAVRHHDLRFAHAAIDAAFDQLRGVEGLMTRFDCASDIGRANLGAWAAPVRVSHATALVVEAALEWAAASAGAFDPCIGKAVVLWDVANRKEPPATRAVERLADRALYRALELDTWAGDPIVRFTDRDVALDLGGIAKGYGVDRAVKALRDWGVTDGLVNVGGDLYALGTSDDGDPWRVGIRSPHDPWRLERTIGVSDAAVATSGDYLQFFQHRDRRYHHLLDPVTSAPHASSSHSVTVTAGSCMTADVAATTVFGMDPVYANRVLRRCAPDAGIVTRL